MIQGAGSDAGKSTLVAALCRILWRRGMRVTPFKPQNMALNSAVTVDGGEIGRLFWLRSQDCFRAGGEGAEPRVDRGLTHLDVRREDDARAVRGEPVRGDPAGAWQRDVVDRERTHRQRPSGEVAERLGRRRRRERHREPGRPDRLDQGLLDELVLLIHPVVAGGGRKKLFADDAALTKLKLIEATPTSSGVIVAKYHPVN